MWERGKIQRDMLGYDQRKPWTLMSVFIKDVRVTSRVFIKDNRMMWTYDYYCEF